MKLKLFEDKKIRSHWDDDEEQWYFSVIDTIEVLTESKNPRDYWFKMKLRVKTEAGFELSTICRQFKLKANDGKLRLTDIANVQSLLRIIQSVPSPKAEPFKQWLAKVGSERIDEINDPEIGIERLMETYLKKGYSKEWINQRLKSIEVRKELTDEWENRGVKKGEEYAILTDEITKGWSGFTTKEYKKLKDLKKENLRDNMTNLELVLNMLAEATTTEISKEKEPKTFLQNKKLHNMAEKLQAIQEKPLKKKVVKKL